MWGLITLIVLLFIFYNAIKGIIKQFKLHKAMQDITRLQIDEYNKENNTGIDITKEITKKKRFTKWKI